MFTVGAKIVTAMESRWRGANGEVGGDAGDEYARRCSCLRLRKQRIGGMVESCPVAQWRILKGRTKPTTRKYSEYRADNLLQLGGKLVGKLRASMKDIGG